MRKLLLTAALVGTLMTTPGLVPQARADHGWFATGAGFRVGAAHISFVFGQPFGHYAPAYYYRYDRPISYRGHACSRSCYRQGGYYYHHESCPLVRAHFRAYSVDPYWAYSRYAPSSDYGYDGYSSGGYYGDGYSSGDGYYNGDGYYGGGGYVSGSIYYRSDRYRNRSHHDGYYRDHRYNRDRSYRDHRSYRDRDHRSYRDRGDRRDRHDGDRRRDHNRGDRDHRRHRGY